MGVCRHTERSIAVTGLRTAMSTVLALSLTGAIVLAAQPEPRSIQAVRIKTPPAIDGKLDDACWKQAQPLTDFLSIDSTRPASFQTLGYICYDDFRLFIGMKCLVPPGVKPRVEPGSPLKKNHDDYLFSDDAVEIMIDPGRTLSEYYQLAATAYGSTFDGFRRYGGAQFDVNWNGDWTSATHIGDGFWSIELEIPFHSLGVTTAAGDDWGINLCRATWMPKDEHSSIAMQGTFHNMEDFAVLKGLDVDFARSRFQIGPEAMVLDLSGSQPRALFNMPVRNMTEGRRKITVERIIKQSDGREAGASKGLVLKPGQEHKSDPETLRLEPLFPGRTDAFLVTSEPRLKRISVKDAEEGTVLAMANILRPWYFEAMKVEVKDPWQRDMTAEKTSIISLVVYTRLAQRQLSQATMVVSVRSVEGGEVLWEKSFPKPKQVMPITIPATDLPWEAYIVRASVRGTDANELMSASGRAAVMPGGKHRLKVLNNLVTELANADERGQLDEAEIPFMNPRDGWILFSFSGKGSARLGNEKTPLLTGSGSSAVEAKRYLPAGRHVLHIEGDPEQVIVRAVPELIYSSVTGQYGWDYLKKHVLPHCNAILGNANNEAAIKEWTSEGGRWFGFSAAPGHGTGGNVFLDARSYYSDRLSKAAGFSHPLMSGVFVDQISACVPKQKVEIARMLSTIAANPALTGREYRPWFEGGVVGSSADHSFMKVVLDSGWAFSYYIYIPEKEDEARVRDVIRSSFTKNATSCNKELPESMKRCIVQPGYMSDVPTGQNMNVDPGRSYKLHMQMQFETFANDPAFFGMYGTMWYYSPYVNEEYLRWGGALFRHYGIEGESKPLSTDPYILPHLRNPDFADGLTGWTVDAAEKETIRADTRLGYGGLHGRFISGSKGDSILVMKRSKSRPNVFSQDVNALTPGRMYSLKLLTADYRDIVGEISAKKKSAISIRLVGVELSTVEGHRLDEVYPSHYGSRLGKFNKDYTAFFTYHWRVFRAAGKTARLTVSDWAAPGTPGGPIGQELMYNFVEIEPYFEESQ